MSDFKFEVWPTDFRHITQHFGANPQNYAQFGLPGHEGIDIMAPDGAKIFAVAPGRVKMVETRPDRHPYGIHVRISHRDGYETIYAHFKNVRVNVNDQVAAGDLIGTADNTGNSFGSHLHLTLKKAGAQIGDWPPGFIDPTPFLLPLLGWQEPAGPYTAGWAYTQAIIQQGDLAQVNAGGINLRAEPSVHADKIDLVPAGTIMLVTGERRGFYTPVQVPTAALSHSEPEPPAPPPAPAPGDTDTTVNGWAWNSHLTIRGNQATIGQFGINLRAEPRRTAQNIGLVKGGSIATVTGAVQGEYTPVRVRRADFSGPVNLPEIPPDADAEPSPSPAPSDSVLGWAWTQNLTISGGEAVSGRFGTTLRNAPTRTAASLGIFREGASGGVVGKSRGEYTPVRVSRSDVQNLVSPLPDVTQPEPVAEDQPAPSPEPIHDTTPGWAFTTQLSVAGGMATAGQFGINLRAAPKRSAQNLGFVPANASMIVTGAPQGEYTPVRVDDDVLQSPLQPTVVSDATEEPEVVDPDPALLGAARIGLHASADPAISDAEIAAFAEMRPGMIKLLSFHNPEGVEKLAEAHPDVSWIVRAFLDFGGRNISPAQFVRDTISDMKRTLSFLKGRDVVLELHNEPNLVAEGLGSAWQDGTEFARWWKEVLDRYRQELPSMRYIYPGLSPGASVRNVKQDHVEFLEASRDAVDAADGLGVHIYWSNVYPMERALDVLDDYINRFRRVPIWVTEASNNKGGTLAARKGMEYLEFWQALQERPMVQGVTYFVASASNEAFRHEVWVGRNIAPVVGRR